MGDIYVVNGFYATMQADYVEPGASIYYYSVQWNAASLSWEEFRSSVLGATDPSGRHYIIQERKTTAQVSGWLLDCLKANPPMCLWMSP